MNKVALGLVLFAGAEATETSTVVTSTLATTDAATTGTTTTTPPATTTTDAATTTPPATTDAATTTAPATTETVAAVVSNDPPSHNCEDNDRLKDLIQKRTFNNKFHEVKTAADGMPAVSCKGFASPRNPASAPKCVDGEWKLPESDADKPKVFKCIPKKCNIKWEQANPFFNHVEFTDNCTMRCKKGYVLKGAKSEYNWEEGIWSGRSDFECIETTKPKCTEDALQSRMGDKKLRFDKDAEGSKSKNISCEGDKWQLGGSGAWCKDGLWGGFVYCEKTGKVCSQEKIEAALKEADVEATFPTYLSIRTDAQAQCKRTRNKYIQQSVTVTCDKNGEVSVEGDCEKPQGGVCAGLEQRVKTNGAIWKEDAQKKVKNDYLPWNLLQMTRGQYKCKGSAMHMEVLCKGGRPHIVQSCPITPAAHDECSNYVADGTHTNEITRIVGQSKVGKTVFKSCRKDFHIENMFGLDARAEKIKYECQMSHFGRAAWVNVHNYTCVEDQEVWNPKMHCKEFPTGLIPAEYGLSYSHAEGHVALFQCPKGYRTATGLSAVSLVCKAGMWSSYFAISIQSSVRCIKEEEPELMECNASALPFLFYTNQLIRTNLWTNEWTLSAGLTRKFNCKAGFMNEDYTTETEAVCQGGKWVFEGKACSVAIVPEPKLECVTEIKKSCASVLVESAIHYRYFSAWAVRFVNFCSITVEKMEPTMVMECEKVCNDEIKLDAIFTKDFVIFQRPRVQTCRTVCNAGMQCARRRMLEESNPVIV